MKNYYAKIQDGFFGLSLGWWVTIFLCALTVLFWFMVRPLDTIFSGDFMTIMLNLGKITGLIGMVLYSLNLVYSTRLRFIEDLFGGLNRVYIAHHIVGGLALVFLVFHPLFLSLQYITTSLRDAAFLLLPHDLVPVKALFDTSNTMHLDVLEQWAIFFGIIALWGMVILLILTFYIKLPYQLWVFTHKFLGLAFFLGGLHVLFISSDTSKNNVLKYYILGLAFIGLAAFIYRTIMPKITVRKFKYRVSMVQSPNPSIVKINLVPVSKVMSYKPGQFVFIRFLRSGVPAITSEWHPFSISSAPSEAGLEITAKSLGDYSSQLSKIQPNTLAEIEGAYGKFTYYNFSNFNQIWIAGGIGITPFISMAKSLPATGFSIDLYYSVKSESELVDWPKLAQIARSANGNFRLIPFVADKQQGFLSLDFMRQYSGTFDGKDIFICGPPAMMKSLKSQFIKAGVKKNKIHSEEFSMS